jgi:hypothetical protein
MDSWNLYRTFEYLTQKHATDLFSLRVNSGVSTDLGLSMKNRKRVLLISPTLDLFLLSKNSTPKTYF